MMTIILLIAISALFSAGASADWKMYRNFCVSDSNKDLKHTKHNGGNENIHACQSECLLNPKCSAVEWYQRGWRGTKCYLILDDIPATKGSPYRRWRDATCHIKPGVSDTTTTTTVEDNTPVKKIRLVGGNNANEGRVELLHQENWGTVCDDSFDRRSADVVCRMMDMGKASYWGTKFGPGTGEILLDGFYCTGKESSLFDCLSSGIKHHNCFHWQDIGVTCTGNQPTPTLLEPFFEFYEGNSGTKDRLCRVSIDESNGDFRMNKGQMRGLGCENDEARSMKLCYAKRGTRIRVYDDGNLSPRSDDWTEINVLKDMNNNCETINTFERTATYGVVNVVYKTTGNLDGKVSSFEVIFQCSENGPIYIGCYKDDRQRDLEDGPKKYGYKQSTCNAACKDYKYFALQHNGWCVCGDAYATAAKYVKKPDSECGGKGRGAAWRNSIYHTCRDERFGML